MSDARTEEYFAQAKAQQERTTEWYRGYLRGRGLENIIAALSRPLEFYVEVASQARQLSAELEADGLPLTQPNYGVLLGYDSETSDLTGQQVLDEVAYLRHLVGD